VTATSTNITIPAATATQTIVFTPRPPKSFSITNNIIRPSRGEVVGVKYGLDGDADVRIKVYSKDGRMIKTLICGKETQGLHETSWNGCDDKGIRANTGLYFIHVKIGDFEKTEKAAVIE
jgi:flagellar hook assembly protein FlgD